MTHDNSLCNASEEECEMATTCEWSPVSGCYDPTEYLQWFEPNNPGANCELFTRFNNKEK